jgi:hypothetical protein
MEVACSSQTMGDFQQATQSYIPRGLSHVCFYGCLLGVPFDLEDGNSTETTANL